MSHVGACESDWNPDALASFQDSLSANLDPDVLGGEPWKTFSENLENVDVTLLPDGKLTRSKVLSIASDPCVDIKTVCAAIMAWGVMKSRFRDLLFKSTHPGWLNIATEIRSGQLSRQCAYKKLKKLREEKKLKGAGPAYFTKLIYFLLPRNGQNLSPGYIMDQWAGCAVNLLTGEAGEADKNIVLMDVTKTWHLVKGKPVASSVYRVSDANTEQNYENFCKKIDRLAKCFDLNTDAVDKALVGSGGKKPSSWRRYIINNRTP